MCVCTKSDFVCSDLLTLQSVWLFFGFGQGIIFVFDFLVRTGFRKTIKSLSGSPADECYLKCYRSTDFDGHCPDTFAVVISWSSQVQSTHSEKFNVAGIELNWKQLTKALERKRDGQCVSERKGWRGTLRYVALSWPQVPSIKGTTTYYFCGSVLLVRRLTHDIKLGGLTT